MSVYNTTPGNDPPPAGATTTARISPAADPTRTSSSRNFMKINLTDKFPRTASAPRPRSAGVARGPRQANSRNTRFVRFDWIAARCCSAVTSM
ncbi:hypothetical protein Acy02nite_83320 [Actinoplanes cyaneus]|uniref:Uncharacterized protein n=1 Tax=Actinoplanes cyaneus TaxID=52696 RepID=A0A919ISX9_9ACTN|nr:hypothetical protein Acy02nite_83320 [Actinoplanes cyaneus]